MQYTWFWKVCMYVSFIDCIAGLQKLEAYIILWKQTKRTNMEHRNMKRKRARKAPGLQHPNIKVVTATNKNKQKKPKYKLKLWIQYTAQPWCLTINTIPKIKKTSPIHIHLSTYWCKRVPLEIVDCIFVTLDENSGSKYGYTKYLKENFGLWYDNYFFLK